MSKGEIFSSSDKLYPKISSKYDNRKRLAFLGIVSGVGSSQLSPRTGSAAYFDFREEWERDVSKLPLADIRTL